MATFYVGPRPVLQGRNIKNFLHASGEAEVYSHAELIYNGNELLTGMPDHEYVLGTGRNATLLEYIYSGRPHIEPLSNPGNTAPLDGTRFHPHTYRGLDSAKAL